MIRFIESPIYDNWFKKHYPNKKVLICTPYIKQGALDRVLDLYDIETRCDQLDIKVLIRGSSREFTKNKSSDISVLDSFLAMKNFNIDNMKRIENLHMKAYLIDDEELLITSGNLTNSGMFVFSGKENFEGGIATDDENVIGKFLEYFNSIWNQGECLEAFYEKVFEDYAEYITTEYSDSKAIKTIRKKKYSFSTVSELDEDDSKPIEDEYSLDDLPPVGRIEHLEDTLTILNNNKAGLTYVQLGQLLRKKYGYDNLENIVNNRKFGEEKGKFALYFGLVNLTKGQSNVFTISKLGELFLSFDKNGQMKYLKDQLFSKPIIIDIIRKSANEAFSIDKYLAELHLGTESTLARKKGAISRLISHLKEMYPEGELKEIIEKIQDEKEA